MNLFTKTYSGDFEWIELAIYSVLNHCQESVNWYIACERLNRQSLNEVVGRARAHFPKREGDNFQTFDEELVWPECQNIINGYMRQQWIKMNVHKLVHEHLVWNWDSDCIATHAFNSSIFEKDKKPIWFYEDINHMIMGGYPKSRKDVICNFFNDGCGKEYMRTMPVPLLGKCLMEGAKTDIWTRSLAACHSNLEGFSEFNILGEYCHRYFNDLFEWKDCGKEPTWSGEASDPKKVLAQMWSWGKVNDGIRKLVLGG